MFSRSEIHLDTDYKPIDLCFFEIYVPRYHSQIIYINQNVKKSAGLKFPLGVYTDIRESLLKNKIGASSSCKCNKY